MELIANQSKQANVNMNIAGFSENIDRDEKLKDQNILLCYMHATKFEKFLQDGLRLTRSDFFQKDDPFEAEFTEEIYKFVKNISITDPNGNTNTGLESLKNQCDEIRKNCFVSCWTKGPFENVALWRLYGKQKNAVAIETNVGKLQLQLGKTIHSTEKNRLALGLCKKRIIKVEYIDHFEHASKDGESLLGGIATKILHFKNIGYKYEAEVRVIFDTYQTAAANQFGERILINVVPEELIKQILVSPYASNYYFKSIKKLLLTYNLADKVRWSKLKYVPGDNLKETNNSKERIGEKLPNNGLQGTSE